MSETSDAQRKRFDAASSGLPRSFLRPILYLLLAEEPAHGYDLLERVAAFGLERADPGGLYRTLRAMEQDGLVRSWWENSTAGPSRRTYALTEEGVDWLHASAGSLRDVTGHLQSFVARYERVAADLDATSRR